MKTLSSPTPHRPTTAFPAILLLAAAITPLLAQTPPSPQPTSQRPTQPAPATASAPATTPRPVADVSWLLPNGQPRKLSTLRGQPVIILIARSPGSWTLRRQLARLTPTLQRLLAAGTVFITGFTEKPGPVPSNIPFLLLENPTEAAASLGIPPGRFGIALIGKDGNLDAVFSHTLSGQRILDIIRNSYVYQTELRR